MRYGGLMTTAPSIALQDHTTQDVTQQVLTAIATREGTSPVDLDQPLYDAIDPDALNALFSGPTPPVSVQFTYLGYEVVVRGDGTVDVTDADQQSA